MTVFAGRVYTFLASKRQPPESESFASLPESRFVKEHLLHWQSLRVHRAQVWVGRGWGRETCCGASFSASAQAALEEEDARERRQDRVSVCFSRRRHRKEV